MTRTRTRPRGTHRLGPGRAGVTVRWRRRITWGRAVWRRLSARPGIDHLVRAGERFSDRLGNQFAAAITYFSFLSLVPILMVTFSAAGFVLASRPDLLDGLRAQVTALVGSTFGDLIGKAVDSRTSVGVTGLLVAAYSGLNWIGNVRDAVQAQWRPTWEHDKAVRQGFWMDRLTDLISLLGLLVAVLVSFSLTAVGTAAQDLVVSLFGLQDVRWLTPVLTVGPFVLAIAADVLIFAWVYTIFPLKANRAGRRTLLIGALAMALSFEVLKAALTLVFSRLSSSPSWVVFGSVIGLLFFFNLVARVFLMVAAWIATGAESEAAATDPVATAPVTNGAVATLPVAPVPVATEPVATEPVATESVAAGVTGARVAAAVGSALALGWLIGRRTGGGRGPR